MENEQPTLNYDWNLLGNAQVAQQYLAQGKEGVPFAKKSLELILSDANIKDPWIVQTVTDPEILRKTIENQLETYQQYKGNQTVGDLLDYYSNDISKYLGDNAEIANEELARFTKEKYSDILKKIEEAKYIIKGKEYGRSSDKEIEAAKKTIEKYQKVPLTFNLLERLYSGRFGTRVEEEVAKDHFKELYKPKESEE